MINNITPHITEKKIDFIWNISLVCPWDCQFCCTDAAHVKNINGLIQIRSKGLSVQHILEDHERFSLRSFFYEKYGVEPTLFDIASLKRQQLSEELSFDEKLSVLHSVLDSKVKIDFSGGDPLALHENRLVIEKANSLIGKSNISVTSTGYFFNQDLGDWIVDNVGQFEFTFDEATWTQDALRPHGYNASNYSIARRMINAGIHVKAQIPISKHHIDLLHVVNIVKKLAESRCTDVLLMRTFPVGRAASHLNSKWFLTRDQIIIAIENFFEASIKIGIPRPRLQCALKGVYEYSDKNPCDLMHNSFGINFQGLLLLSAWATNAFGMPLDDVFVLGDLKKNKFSDIIRSEKANKIKLRLDENFGHCKIFSYIFGGKTVDSVFRMTDPLYS